MANLFIPRFMALTLISFCSAMATLLASQVAAGNPMVLVGAAAAVNSVTPGSATGEVTDYEALEPQLVPIATYLDLEALFIDLNYTPESWMAGIREVPRMYLREITDRWSKHTVKEIDVLTKKRLFFRVLAPLVLRSNELAMLDRQRMQRLAKSPSLTADDEAWLAALAAQYRVAGDDVGDHMTLIEVLMPRVDIVPVSLVLSQAAEESGWGTSRFAFTGNALFGQWTWGDGMTPKGQRSGKGDYKIAAFETPLDSVRAHSLNLNSHPAYETFREVRAKLRRNGERVSGAALAPTLSKYSERGEDYVKTLNAIMRVNRLNDADDAYLAAMRPMILVRPERME
jgi:Bax protein